MGDEGGEVEGFVGALREVGVVGEVQFTTWGVDGDFEFHGGDMNFLFGVGAAGVDGGAIVAGLVADGAAFGDFGGEGVAFTGLARHEGFDAEEGVQFIDVAEALDGV